MIHGARKLIKSGKVFDFDEELARNESTGRKYSRNVFKEMLRNRPAVTFVCNAAVFHFCRSLLFGLESLRLLAPGVLWNERRPASVMYVHERRSFAHLSGFPKEAGVFKPQ